MRRWLWMVVASCGGASHPAPVANVAPAATTTPPTRTFCELLVAHDVAGASKIIGEALASSHDLFLALLDWTKAQPCSLGASQQGDSVHLNYKIGPSTNYSCDTRPAIRPFTMTCEQLIDI